MPIEPIGSAPLSAIGATMIFELLVRVAEHLLAAQHAVMAEHDVLALGQIDELGHALLEPLGVRVLGGERALDLLVVDDATLGGVDQEHLAGLQAALGDDLGGVDVDHADLATPSRPGRRR